MIYSLSWPDRKYFVMNLWYHYEELGRALKFSHVNRQMRAEVLRHLFANCILRMDSDDLCNYARTDFYSIPVGVRQAITRLEFGLDIDYTRDADRFSDFSFTVFPSLKHLEIMLGLPTCLYRAGPPYYGNPNGPSPRHDAQPIETNGLMNNPVIEWLSKTRGLEEFVLTCIYLSRCCISVGGYEAVRALEKKIRAVVTKGGSSSTEEEG